MDNDNDNSLYDYSTFQGRTRRALHRLTWKNLGWGISIFLIVAVAVTVIATRPNDDGSNGSASGNLLLSELGRNSFVSGKEHRGCNASQFAVEESLSDIQEIKQCLTPPIKKLLNSVAINRNKYNNDKRKKQHPNSKRIKKQAVTPVCTFLNEIQCSKQRSDPKHCAGNVTQSQFDTFVEQINESICGINEQKLIALIASGVSDCIFIFPESIGKCFYEPVNDQETKQRVSKRSCGPITKVHQCLFKGAIACGHRSPVRFQEAFSVVELWVNTNCKEEINETHPESKTRSFEPESASTTLIPGSGGDSNEFTRKRGGNAGEESTPTPERSEPSEPTRKDGKDGEVSTSTSTSEGSETSELTRKHGKADEVSTSNSTPEGSESREPTRKHGKAGEVSTSNSTPVRSETSELTPKHGKAGEVSTSTTEGSETSEHTRKHSKTGDESSSKSGGSETRKSRSKHGELTKNHQPSSIKLAILLAETV